MGLGLSSHFGLILLELVVLQPLGFFLLFLLEQDGLLTILVYILHEIDSGLILSSPLGLSCFPLLNVLVLNELIDHLFIFGFLISDIAVMLLKLDNLIPTSLFFSGLQVLHLLLSGEGCIEQFLVSQSVLLFSQFSELFLSGIMVDQL